MERIIITTGGTGGHIFPAIAVAEEIRHRYPHASLLFVGGEYGPEADMAAAAGIPFTSLPVQGLVGRGLKAFPAALAMLRGIGKARAIIRKTNPQVVIGFGGYAAFASVVAAKLEGTPTALHEQNSIPGLSNKILGRLAHRIFLSMPDSTQSFNPVKTELTGNPVRAAITALNRTDSYPVQQCTAGAELYTDVFGQNMGGETLDGQEAPCNDPVEETPSSPIIQDIPPQIPHLLVMGGSLGARAINRAVVNALPTLLEAGVAIWHQTGKAEYEEVRAGYRAAKADQKGHVRLEAFIDDMSQAYAWADAALCRAGASSLAELAVAGVPAILVPYPFAARNHQQYNAMHMVNAGAALLCEQEKITQEGTLTSLVLSLLKDQERLALMSAQARTLAKPNAAKHIVDALERLLVITRKVNA